MDILVVCYDIEDDNKGDNEGDNRRNDVSEFLKDYGGCRVQDSVFELEMDAIEDEVPTLGEILRDYRERVIDADAHEAIEAIELIRESKVMRNRAMNRAIKLIKDKIKDKIDLKTDKVDIYLAKKTYHLGKKR